MNLSRFTSFALAAALFTGVTAAAARADISAGGGVYTSSGNGASSGGPAIFLSTGKAVPVLPASVDLTGFAPLGRNGGYAVTLEGRFAAAGNAIGAGYGIGQFGGARAGGTFTLFLDHAIAPLTSIELRGYQTTGSSSSTAGFLGVRFTL